MDWVGRGGFALGNGDIIRRVIRLDDSERQIIVLFLLVVY